jgi:hypothetical protein
MAVRYRSMWVRLVAVAFCIHAVMPVVGHAVEWHVADGWRRSGLAWMAARAPVTTNMFLPLATDSFTSGEP